MDTISIIVPVYNIEAYIADCIESIILQTYKELEIILVDDGSTDKCYEICRTYEEKDNRIKVFKKKNGGLSSARNYGMKCAKGAFYMFVDGDDKIEPKLCEILLKLMHDYQADITICDLYQDRIEKKAEKIAIFKPEKAIEEMLKEKSFNTSACGKLYKKEVFQNVMYPEGKLYEDLGTTYLLFHHAKKIVYFNHHLYYYRVRSNSIMNVSFHHKKMDLIGISIQQLRFLQTYYPKLVPLGRNRMTRYCISFLKELTNEENYEDCVKILKYYVRRGILPYLFSNYKLSSKLFGLIACCNFNAACKVYKCLKRYNES